MVTYYGILAGLNVQSVGVEGVMIDEVPTNIQWMIVLYPRSIEVGTNKVLNENWTLAETFPGWVDWGNGDVLVYRRNEE